MTAYLVCVCWNVEDSASAPLPAATASYQSHIDRFEAFVLDCSASPYILLQPLGRSEACIAIPTKLITGISLVRVEK